MVTSTYSISNENASDPFNFYAEHGAALFPVPRGKKAPHGIVGSFKHDHSRNPEIWKTWRIENPGCNFGVVGFASGWIIADVDTSGGEDGRAEARALWADLCASWGLPAPLAFHVESQSGGWHAYFQVPAGTDAATLRQPDAIKGRINIRCVGYTIAAGSQFEGRPYRLLTNEPPHPAPAALVEHCTRLPRLSTGAPVLGEYDADDTAALLLWLNEHDQFEAYEDWVEVGMALKLSFGDDGFGLWEMTHDGSVSPGQAEAKWNSFAATSDGSSVTLKTFMDRAHKLGWTGSIRRSAGSMFDGVAQLAAAAGNMGMTVPGTSLMERNGAVPTDTEDALAISFADLHADDLRYVEEFGKWMKWNGNTWAADRTSEGFDMVRKHLRKFAGGLTYQDARKIATAKTVAAVERMARTDRRIVTTGDIWDADPWLLNTPGGVVDLRTGEMRPALPGDLMTKTTTVAPGGDCPTWRAFLDKSLAGDVELIAFIQRVLGYALTGDTREHALFFMYGAGGNGKGVLLNTVAGIVGAYQKTAPVDTFIDSPHERHPTDLAGLRGARLVTASETEKGRRWAEAKIKMLTGGDPIAARFMRQDFFEFIPQFKLVIAGNHQPSLRSVDAAMRRRMHMIPFTVNIPESERDPTLPARLKAEWGGILSWLIEGCLAWQGTGLQPPAAVRDATEEYLANEDVLSTWLSERCIVGPGEWAPRNELFTSFVRWADASREHAGTQKQFLDAMRQHEFEEAGRNGVRGFRGVRVKPIVIPLPPLPY